MIPTELQNNDKERPPGGEGLIPDLPPMFKLEHRENSGLGIKGNMSQDKRMCVPAFRVEVQLYSICS